MMRRLRASDWILLGTLAFVLLVAADALARPGGGGSYSGGSSSHGSSSSHSSGGGSSGGGGEDFVGFLLGILFQLLPWPLKLVVVVLFFVIPAIAKWRNSTTQPDWSSSSPPIDPPVEKKTGIDYSKPRPPDAP